MTIIVPVDFSAQSINAASFATKMLTGIYDAEVVLYHLYQEDSEHEIVKYNLEKIKQGLSQSSIVKMRCQEEKGTKFVEALGRLINKEDASLVVMSVSDRVKLFEDSYSLQMMAHSSCPVLVIPYGYLYNDVKTVAVASDFKEVDKTIPLAKVKKILSLFRPQLHIVHVNPQQYVSVGKNIAEQRTQLQEMFSEFNPQFHFIATENFAEGLGQFIDEKNIDLVLTFPRKHSYLSSLIKGTNTQKLVYKNAVPVLAAHD